MNDGSVVKVPIERMSAQQVTLLAMDQETLVVVMNPTTSMLMTGRRLNYDVIKTRLLGQNVVSYQRALCVQKGESA